MAEIGILGNLQYMEHVHGWALNAGEEAARILYYSSVPRKDEPQHKLNDAIDRLIATIPRELQLNLPIPPSDQRRDGRAIKAAQLIVDRATDAIQGRGLAQHFAFWQIGFASRTICLLAASDNYERKHGDFLAIIDRNLRSVNHHFPGLAIKPVPMQAEIARYISFQDSLEVEIPVRDIIRVLSCPFVVLSVSATPWDQDLLNVDLLTNTMALALAPAHKRYVPLHLSNCRPDQLAKLMTSCHPTILHFSGHGNNQVLAFENKFGQTQFVSAAQLAGMLQGADRMGLRVVILSACYSASTALVIADTVNCLVVATEQSLTVGDAWLFTTVFYENLAQGRAPDDAFEKAKKKLGKDKVEAIGLRALEGGL